MKSSIEFKRSEQKLNGLCKLIRSKEEEKESKKQQIENGKLEMKNLKIAIKENGNTRFSLNEELNNMQSQLKKNQDEMNRIRAGLLYETKKEYEDMIKRFENELQNNGRRFSPHEEARLLQDIKIHKQGICQLERFEEKKQIYDQLKEMFKSKKLQQDENWNKVNELKNTLSSYNESNKFLTKQITDLEIEISELNNKKVELKKLIEDLSREHLLKQQQARKLNEKNRNLKQLKLDDTLSNMERKLRELNKLVNYFQKRLNTDEFSDTTATSPSCSSHNLSLSSTNFALCHINKLQSKQNILSSSSSSSSLISLASTFNQSQFNQTINSLEKLSLNDANYANRPTTLNLVNDTINSHNHIKNENIVANEEDKKSNQLNETTPSSTITASTPFTPNDDSGLYIMKKKLDDDLLFHRKKISRKSRTNKVTKISHPLDVITSLDNLNIPIALSSQLDECFKLLVKRRDDLMHEINEYKKSKQESKGLFSSMSFTTTKTEQKNNQDYINIEKKDIDLGKTATTSNENTSLFSDANSDISSCLDSNYESDYSIGSVKRKQIDLDKIIKKSEESKPVKFTLGLDEEIKETNLASSKNIENKAILSVGLINSDDSDVTINDHDSSSSSLLSTKLCDIKKVRKLKNICGNESNSSDGSNNTLAPCSPKTPISYENLDSLNKNGAENEPIAKQSDQNILLDDQKESAKLFARQLSDGYSSSYTPLSASSINSEQPNKNPFFNSITNQDTK